MVANTTPRQREHATGANDPKNPHNLTVCVASGHSDRDPLRSDPATAFRAAMADRTLHTAEPIRADGMLHRVHLEGDRRGTANGWYILHPDPPVSGAFGCWKRGISGSWSAAKSERLTRAERDVLRRRVEESRAARQRDQAEKQQVAARRAVLWRAAKPADADHPYLVRKRITAGDARQQGDRLVLPVADRLPALDLLAKYGLGTTREITVEHVRDKLADTVALLRAELPPEQVEPLLERMRELWR